MTVNKYFVNYNLNGNNTNEQDLIHKLYAESIQIKGLDAIYLPRQNDDLVDLVLGENILTYFDEYYTIEVYPTNIDGFGGPQTDTIGLLGWSVKDQLTLEVSTMRWNEVINTDVYPMPREGDLWYFPLSKTLFQITFVEDESPFYPRGMLPSWKCNCEIFDYNHEEIDTGLTEIDDLADIVDLSDDTIFNERHPENQQTQTETDMIKQQDKSDIWGEF